MGYLFSLAEIVGAGYMAMPRSETVLVASWLLLAPLLALGLFGNRLAPIVRRLLLGASLGLALALMLAPAVVNALEETPYDNPALPSIPLIFLLYGIPLGAVCLLPSGLVAGLLGWSMTGSERRNRSQVRTVMLRTLLAVWTPLFVPLMSCALWVGVGLIQTG